MPSFTNQLLPFLIFPAISAISLYIIFGHARQSGTAANLHAFCTSSSTSPYTLPYTGIHAIDNQVCTLVATFHMLMIPSNLPFNADLLSSLATVATVPAIENARQNRHALLGIYVAVALIYQRITAAVALPWYWLVFVTTGAARRSRGEDTKVDQAHAEAILFGAFVANVIPSVSMLTMDNPWVTGIWQPFPLWMFIAQHLYLLIRPHNPQSGYQTIQAGYIFLFLLSAIPHLYFWGSAILAGDYAKFQAVFVPSLAIQDFSSTPEAGVLDMIQWDVIFVELSTFLACLWTAKSVTQVAVMTGWCIVGGVVFGVGSAIVGVFAWRERALNCEVNEAHAVKTREKEKSA